MARAPHGVRDRQATRRKGAKIVSCTPIVYDKIDLTIANRAPDMAAPVIRKTPGMPAVRQNALRKTARRLPKPPRPAEADDGELSSSDQVVEHITASILAGRYVPGQRLVEADLTHALRVSRGPVREAFRRLDALGILARTLHRGAGVRTLDRTEALHLLLAVEPLIGLIARLAAEKFAIRPPGPDCGGLSVNCNPIATARKT